MGSKWPGFRQNLRNARWLRQISAALYLVFLTGTILASVVMLEMPGSQSASESELVSEELLRDRRMLVEFADRIVRYQKYYQEVYGRYSGDISSLGVPASLSEGTVQDVSKRYEVFVELRSGQRFYVRARGRPNLRGNRLQFTDALRLDQDFVLQTNFTLPQFSREFLVQAADRALRLYAVGQNPVLGLAQAHWIFAKVDLGNGASKWTATGIRGRVRGASRDQGLGNASLDARIGMERESAGDRAPGSVTSKTGSTASIRDIHGFLGEARFAQHVYLREFGSYADSWRELDAMVGFDLIARVNSFRNLSLEPLELVGDDFRIRVRGEDGDILGEIFSIDRQGAVEQIRFSDVIVERLRNTTEFLYDPNRFQISEVTDENAPVNDESRQKKRGLASPYP